MYPLHASLHEPLPAIIYFHAHLHRSRKKDDLLRFIYRCFMLGVPARKPGTCVIV